MNRRLGLIVSGAIVVSLLMIAVFVLTRPHTFRGSIISPPAPAPDFRLPDGKGGSFQLSEQRGKLVLIFFGYTSCPDVCPTTLSEMKLVQKRLGSLADQVRFVFITVDPARDTPEIMAQYAASFSPSFIGLSGSEEELQPVWEGYGVYHEKRETASAVGYLVDHSAFVYVIDRNGNMRETFSFRTPVDDVVGDVRYLVKER